MIRYHAREYAQSLVAENDLYTVYCFLHIMLRLKLSLYVQIVLNVLTAAKWLYKII